MDRLTKRLENGNAVYSLYGLGAFDAVDALDECVTRLAAYEDTMPLERAQELARAEKDGKI